jgi:hypothetical protein
MAGSAMLIEETMKGVKKDASVATRRADLFTTASFILFLLNVPYGLQEIIEQGGNQACPFLSITVHLNLLMMYKMRLMIMLMIMLVANGK